MSELSQLQYFLGANAPTGFYSLYDQLLPADSARRIFILKGGPGCGKSTLMRTVGARMEGEGLTPEYILCSGDPDSLDALILPTLGVAIVDGTAPHVVEPNCPGVVEQYVNLGSCYDSAALAPLRGDIVGCMADYKGCYQRAYRCLSAAAEISEDMRACLLTDNLAEKLAKRARGILVRELRHAEKQSVPGRAKQRFLGAVTHRGCLCLYSTALAQCERVYELADPCGLAHILLIHLLTGFLGAGLDVVACPDPMVPERMAHLLVPELGLAFLSTTPAVPLPADPYRRIRLLSMADQTQLHTCRSRFRFTKRVSGALVEEAIGSLAQAKGMHDELEALYNPHVDFRRVEQIAQAVGDEILSL